MSDSSAAVAAPLDDTNQRVFRERTEKARAILAALPAETPIRERVARAVYMEMFASFEHHPWESLEQGARDWMFRAADLVSVALYRHLEDRP